MRWYRLTFAIPTAKSSISTRNKVRVSRPGLHHSKNVTSKQGRDSIFAGSASGLLFVRVAESKSIKNRLHLDFRPDDRDVEVERLIGLGATRVDIGQ